MIESNLFDNWVNICIMLSLSGLTIDDQMFSQMFTQIRKIGVISKWYQTSSIIRVVICFPRATFSMFKLRKARGRRKNSSVVGEAKILSTGKAPKEFLKSLMLIKKTASFNIHVSFGANSAAAAPKHYTTSRKLIKSGRISEGSQ